MRIAEVAFTLADRFDSVIEKEKMKTFFAVLAAGAIIFAAFRDTYPDNRKVWIQSGPTPTPTPDTPTPSPPDTPTPTPIDTPTPTPTPTSASPDSPRLFDRPTRA